MSLDLLVKEALSQLSKAPVDQWEVYAVSGQSQTVGVRDGEVDKYQASASLAAAFRVIKDHRLGFAYLHGLGNGSVAAAVDQAVQAAKAADPQPALALAGPAGPMVEVDVFDPAILDEPEEAKIDRARRLADAAKNADPRVVKVQPAQVSQGSSQMRLINSLGLDVSHSATSAGAAAAVLAAQGDEQEQGYHGESTRYIADLDVEAVGRQAAREATAALGGKPVPDGKYNVILDNGITSDFLGILAPSFAADNIFKGRSMLAGKLGEMVFGPVIHLSDQPHYPKGPGTSPCDGEGTPTQATTLVEDGRIASFVYDLLYAKLMNTVTTGNSSRGGVGGPPGIGFSNLILRPGDISKEELIKELGNGLIISEIMGGHTANPVSGEFSFGASGQLVENGSIVRPVKSIAIAGQILQFLAGATRAASDLRFFGKTGCASLLVENVSVSGP